MINRILIIVLLVLNGVVGFLIYRSVKDDVEYASKVFEIDFQVIERLQEVQRAQLAYKDMKGKFAGDFDSLIYFFENEKYMKIRSVGDLDQDSLSGLSIDTIYLDPKIEFFTADYDLNKLALVPPHDTAKFIIRADFIEKNNIKLPVFEVEDPYPFNKKRTLKIGSMSDAIYSGNWK